MKERRKLDRFDLRVPAKIEAKGEDHHQQKEVLCLLTKNISADGAFFDTTNPLPKGTQVEIDLVLERRVGDLPDIQSHIKLSGAVLRPESTGMAILFDRDYKIMPLSKA